MFAGRFQFTVIPLLLLASAVSARAGEALSYADLVGRMTDLAWLAVLPEAGEKCAPVF